jgi:hypothetical protein
MRADEIDVLHELLKRGVHMPIAHNHTTHFLQFATWWRWEAAHTILRMVTRSACFKTIFGVCSNVIDFQNLPPTFCTHTSLTVTCVDLRAGPRTSPSTPMSSLRGDFHSIGAHVYVHIRICVATSVVRATQIVAGK